MNIPEEVVDAADSLRESWRADEANQLIAAWARKEALREAAEIVCAADFVRTRGGETEYTSGANDALEDAAVAIRALMEEPAS
jgi:Tfp pilus assembly protein PilW